jgi:predicted lipoprotein with Yx(FWY)xxD motif
VKVAKTSLGKILVDSQGRTLYEFTKESGTTSECSGTCATAWPPLRANGKPTVGSGANASLVGTTAPSDGGAQVTYSGHPLHLFVKDTKSGDVNGEGVTAFGGSWFAVSPAGNRVSPPSKAGGVEMTRRSRAIVTWAAVANRATAAPRVRSPGWTRLRRRSAGRSLAARAARSLTRPIEHT